MEVDWGRVGIAAAIGIASLVAGMHLGRRDAKLFDQFAAAERAHMVTTCGKSRRVLLDVQAGTFECQAADGRVRAAERLQ